MEWNFVSRTLGFPSDLTDLNLHVCMSKYLAITLWIHFLTYYKKWELRNDWEMLAFQDYAEENQTPPEMPLGDGVSPTIIIFPLVAVLVIICLVVVGVMISRRLRSKSASSGKCIKSVFTLKSRPQPWIAAKITHCTHVGTTYAVHVRNFIGFQLLKVFHWLVWLECIGLVIS